MIVKGAVEDVVFYNDQNGYSVIRVLSDGKLITCVGNMPVVSAGEEVELEGDKITHVKYGEQFCVKNFTVNAPTSKAGVIRYLGSGLIRGVGEITAGKIYDAFGKDTMNVIENEPDRLTRIKGISADKAKVIADCYNENKQMQKQVMFLQGYNISINTAIKIYNVYKDSAKSVVKQNPYKLIDDVDGIGFITADKIAQNLGIDIDSPFRLRAAIIYTLKDTAEKQGNTYLTYDRLKNEAAAILKLDIESSGTYGEVIDRLVLDAVLKDFMVDDNRCIALSRYYNTEKFIASALTKLNRETVNNDADLDVLITEFERLNDIKFHSNQIDAVKAAVTNGVTVITGGPGTGKTTIVKCIAYIFDNHKYKTEFCSPTGRAAKRLALSTDKDAKTIHRLLGMSFSTGEPNFAFNQYNQLPCDAVVVDEVSMVDVFIMNSLLRALQNRTKLILVGDKDQLPSVGAGNVLADIIASGAVDVKYLTHIYRQEADSLIITNAHLINGGKMPKIDNASKDFFFIEQKPDITMVETVVDLVSERLTKFTGTSGFDIQVLGPMKSGIAGVQNLNKRLQAKLNPFAPSKKEIRIGETTFRIGDRVMQTVNDYEMKWTKMRGDIPEQGDGVFNGDIGFITTMEEGLIEITFDDDRVAQYTPLDLYNIQLSYAVTIHKSQGSEFDTLVIALTNGPPTILNKNLLYTAVTRAKKTVVLVCGKKLLNMTVRNNYISERLTLLKRFIKEENEKYDKFFVQN